MMFRPFVIAWKELLQLRRDRLTLAMMAVMPVVLLLLFGYAINTDVRHIPTLIDDHDHSAESRDLVRRMEVTGFYDVVGEVAGYDDIDQALRSGRARVAVVVPPRFAADLARGYHARTCSWWWTGPDPQIVGSALNTAASLVEMRSAGSFASRAWREWGTTRSPEPIDLASDILYNPDQRNGGLHRPWGSSASS